MRGHGSFLFGRICLLVAVTGVSIAEESARSAFRDIRFAEAQRAAAAENKPIFIDFYTTWCAPCKMMDRITFQDEKVVEWLRTRAVSIKVDAERERELSLRYEVRAYPTLILLSADGKEHARHSGYLDANGFMRTVQRWESMSQPSGPVERPEAPRAGGESSDSDDVQNPFARHRRAKSYVVVGRNHEALEDFLWCLDHGAQVDPEFTQVRNQELLEDIRDFGQRYAPATVALRERQETLETRIRNGKIGQRGLKDYVLLTNLFAEGGRLLTVFDSMLPDDELKNTRSALLPFVLPALIEQKRYDDVANSIDDAVGALRKQLAVLDFARQQSGVRPRQVNVLRDDVVRMNGLIFEAFLGAGRETEARRISELLMKSDPRAAVFVDLINHARRVGKDEMASQISARALLETDASEHAGILEAISPRPVIVEEAEAP